MDPKFGEAEQTWKELLGGLGDVAMGVSASGFTSLLSCSKKVRVSKWGAGPSRRGILIRGQINRNQDDPEKGGSSFLTLAKT